MYTFIILVTSRGRILNIFQTSRSIYSSLSLYPLTVQTLGNVKISYTSLLELYTFSYISRRMFLWRTNSRFFSSDYHYIFFSRLILIQNVFLIFSLSSDVRRNDIKIFSRYIYRLKYCHSYCISYSFDCEKRNLARYCVTYILGQWCIIYYRVCMKS